MDFKRPVALTVSDPFDAKGNAMSAAAELVRNIDLDTLGMTDGLSGLAREIGIGAKMKRFDPADALLARPSVRALKAVKDAVLGMLLADENFYEVGEPSHTVLYIPIFQVLCHGEAANRFTTSISYAESATSELDLDLTLEGVGLNLDSHSSFGVSFSLPDPISGSFQLALPAMVETRTYRHKTNDDITGKRSAITDVDAEASIVTSGEAEFAALSGLSYKAAKRFGALNGLTGLNYQIATEDTLEGTLTFPMFKKAGEFNLSAKVSKSSELKVAFSTTKKGVFHQRTGADGPLVHIFDDSDLRLSD